MTKAQFDETRWLAARMLNAMRGVTHLTRRTAYQAAIEHLTANALALLENARTDTANGDHGLARYGHAKGLATIRAAALLANRLDRLR